ncbi:MAG: DUF4292 domain-containing protein [Endomicrobiia bacterium]
MKVVFINFFLLFLISSLYSEKFSIFANFERVVVRANNKESILGSLWYWGSDEYFVDIFFPLKQKIKYNSKNFYLYYPDNNIAFKFSLNSIKDLIYFNPFSAQEIEKLVEKLGYKKNEKKSQNNYSEYKKKSSSYILVILKDEKGRITSLKIKDKKNFVFAHVVYEEYYEVDNRSFPTRLSGVFYDDIRKDYYSEKIEYKDIKINEKVPDEIANFSLPQNVLIKEFDFK